MNFILTSALSGIGIEELFTEMAKNILNFPFEEETNDKSKNQDVKNNNENEEEEVQVKNDKNKINNVNANNKVTKKEDTDTVKLGVTKPKKVKSGCCSSKKKKNVDENIKKEVNDLGI